LRRRQPDLPAADAGDARLVRGPLAIDPAGHEVRVDGSAVTLTATEFRLLHALARHPGRVFTRCELLDRAIGDDADVLDRNVDVHVLALRRKLGRHRDLVQTVRGVGYTLRVAAG
jgi:two-component system alkaline phosphatase synthesis response regulator PhoP